MSRGHDKRATTKRRKETRADRYYPLVAEVEYRIANGRGQIETGFGKTINVSRTTLFFQPTSRLLAGLPIELWIPWPARLDGTVPLTLLVTGKTARADDELVAVSIERYEFRTRRSSRPEF